jgi:dihydrofolate reductase
MPKLAVFNQVSLDGYFTDNKNDMSWAHKSDPEWNKFVENNSTSGGRLLFGRVTYDMMNSFWPTPQAKQQYPVVAEQMNAAPKIVFSKTMKEATWNNAKLVKGDLASEVRKLKQDGGADLVILGSGSIVSQLAQEGLIDDFRIIMNPIILGSGRTLFEGLKSRANLRLVNSRTFKNGNVLLSYAKGD